MLLEPRAQPILILTVAAKATKLAVNHPEYSNLLSLPFHDTPQ
jgi:hypothetical protein